MAAENRHMAFICSKGNLDMAYPALIMGWAALGNGVDVTIFFTFWGLDIINKKYMGKLKLPPVGIAGMRTGMMGFPVDFGIPQIVGVLPGMTEVATAIMRKKIAELDVPPVPEFIEMLMDAGAKLYACKMTVDMMGLSQEDFPEGVEIVTAGDFIDLTDGAQIIFI
ncbi:MAG: hypothetical protein GXO55_00130 [Chloroflexi bacterium]|nr:hypothetical protein [Chloroflexota bacterium]